MRMRTDGVSFCGLWPESSFQQIFHCATGNTGQTIEGFRTGLVEGFPSLLIHLNGAKANQERMGHCEWSSQLTSNFTWSSAQARGTNFQGSLLQALLGSSAQARETNFQGSLPQALLGSSAQARENNFQGSLLQALRVSFAQTPGQAEPVFTRPRVLRFRLRAARLLIASRPNAPLRGLNVGLCGDR